MKKYLVKYTFRKGQQSAVGTETVQAESDFIALARHALDQAVFGELTPIEGHFTVRRLERKYGQELIRSKYDKLSEAEQKTDIVLEADPSSSVSS